MSLSIFNDKSKQPTEDDLKAKLGSAFILWNELKKLIASRFAPVTTEWGFTSKKTGWGLRLKHEKRVIIYMTPCQGYFLASLALGEKAVKAAHKSDLPASVLEIIDNAPKYAEGRGIRLEIRSADDVSHTEKIAMFKMSN